MFFAVNFIHFSAVIHYMYNYYAFVHYDIDVLRKRIIAAKQRNFSSFLLKNVTETQFLSNLTIYKMVTITIMAWPNIFITFWELNQQLIVKCFEKLIWCWELRLYMYILHYVTLIIIIKSCQLPLATTIPKWLQNDKQRRNFEILRHKNTIDTRGRFSHTFTSFFFMDLAKKSRLVGTEKLLWKRRPYEIWR